jgi:UDP-N-acetylmuramoylalanine--D-glutamate ligase
LIVVNPAVKRTHPLLALSAQSGVPLTSEINLLCSRNRAPTIAVTGSIGKSTTATLIRLLLCSPDRRVHLGGNIGGTLLSQLDHIDPADWVVLELSSFQLWDLNHLRFAPDVAVVTNLFPNHLDWHGTFEEYAAAKESITRWQSAAHVLISPQNDAVVRGWSSRARRSAADEFVEFLKSVDLPETLRSGDQLQNASAAIAAANAAVGMAVEECLDRFRSFTPLRHRREAIGVFHGRRFINDSKATTPEAAIAAIRACGATSGRLLLLAGGADKGVCLNAFASEIARSASHAALTGQTAPTLTHLVRRSQGATTVHQASTFDEAVFWLLGQSRPGDTILLSPGCASFGEFVNYEQRGERFRQLVESWTPPNCAKSPPFESDRSRAIA